MFVDSHCHLDRLDLTQYNGQLDLALAAAHKNGVKHFLCVNVNLEDFPKILFLAENYPDVTCSVGVHPTDGETDVYSEAQLIELAQHPKVVAIGETGLDYYRSQADVIANQQENFRQHIRAARKVNKPLIIHTRMAAEDTIRIMQEEKAADVGGVMHCFTENWEVAQQALALNFYISISGIVTFKNADQVKEVAMNVPLERLLIETDSPYLAPVPYRGKPNEPAYVLYVAECIAKLRQLSLEEVAKQTTENFYRLFSMAQQKDAS